MPNSRQNSLFPILKDIHAYLLQLKTTLDNEYEALSNQDTDKLNELAQTKQLLIENLEDLDNERKAMLTSAGLELTRTGVEAYLSRFGQGDSQPKKSELSQLWESISAQTKACEKQNTLNGVIIENQRRRTETALEILQGKSGESETYSKKGKSVSGSRKSTSIRA